MVTLEKLAEMAGVSRATLDRVLHNRPGVKKQTRERILKLIDDIGYKPNSIGKALALQQKLSFGIVLSADLTPEDNTLFTFILDGMQMCIKRLENTGVNFIIRRMTTGLAQDQVKAIDEFIEEGVAGIAVSPEEQKGELKEAVQRARDRGINVVYYFNDIKGTNYNCFLGSDSRKEGRVSGELLCKFMGESGKVAVFSGLLKNNVHQTRINSAVQMINEECPNVDVVEIASGNYTKNIAYNSCTEVLEKHPNLNGIIASCGGIGGLIMALREKNRLENTRIVFFDFTPRAEEYLKEGIVDALIGVDLIRLGYNTIKTLYELALSGSVDEMEISTPMLIKARESI